jgi:hypothetical protein
MILYLITEQVLSCYQRTQCKHYYKTTNKLCRIQRGQQQKDLWRNTGCPTWMGICTNNWAWADTLTQPSWCTISQPPPYLKVTKRARQHEHPGGGKEERRISTLAAAASYSSALPRASPKSNRSGIISLTDAAGPCAYATPFTSNPRGVGALWERERGKRAANPSLAR